MSITINGTTGISGVDGSSTAPAFQGTDTNTGLFYGTDIVGISTGGSERVRVDASGNVGIGTTSPASFDSTGNKLVVGTGSGNQGLSIYAGTTGYASINFADGTTGADRYTGQISYYHTDNALLFATNGGTERMRIASNGQVLIGTTTNTGRSPPLIISNDSGTTNWAVGPSTGGSTQFYVSAGAGVYLSTTSATSWTANSDINLKNVTGKIENALDAIATLTPAKFTWKADETNTPQVGLIAQEVEKVLPEVVDKNADGYLGVRYTEVVPLLVAAIQEQQTIINDLKARVTALEASNV